MSPEPAVDEDAWMRDPDMLERFIVGAIKHRDFEAVNYALMKLAVVDARRAEAVYETLRLGLALHGRETPDA